MSAQSTGDGRPDCASCRGTGWCDDQNWSPQYPDLPQERVEGDGLIRCMCFMFGEEPPFQARVAPWMSQCFGAAIASDVRERGDRLLEEVLELLQSHGYDPTRVATLRDYVFGRPVGEPAQEAGGVMVTLAAYCLATGLDMHGAGDAELERISAPEIIERIRVKQASKRGLHTPLPSATARPAHLDVPSAAVDAGVLELAERLRARYSPAKTIEQVMADKPKHVEEDVRAMLAAAVPHLASNFSATACPTELQP